jgi:hypothetical protein
MVARPTFIWNHFLIIIKRILNLFWVSFFCLHRLMLPLVQLSLIISREIQKQENKLRLVVSYVRARLGVSQFSTLHNGKSTTFEIDDD